MNSKILLIIFLFTVNNLAAQTTWEKLFSQVSTDVLRSVQNVPGGGYVAAGYTADSTVHDTDAFVLRLTSSGDTSWTYRYDDAQHGKDLLYKIINTSDGGFLAVGYTTGTSTGTDDVIIIKLSSGGSRQWKKTWGGSGRDRAQDVIQLPDGSYVITGYSTSSPAQYYDAFLLKTDGSGNEVWSKYFGSIGYDDANAVRLLADGGFILGGQSDNGTSGLDQFLIRTNSSGNVIWQKKNGTGGTDNIESILLLSDGFLLAGGSNGGGGNVDHGYVVKTDTAGNVIWSKFFGTTGPDDFHRIEATADGKYILSGTTSSYGPALPNVWLMKMDTNGDEIWTKTFGGDNHDHGYSAIQSPDGGYVVVGHSGSFGFNNEEGIVIKTDASGNVSNKLTYTAVFQIIDEGCASANATMQFVIRNFGETTVSSVPVDLNISGVLSQNMSGTYSNSFPAGSIDTVSISNINLAAAGSYTFKASTDNRNDVYPARNNLIVTKTLAPCVGIDEIAETSYSVYPNPAADVLLIDLANSLADLKVSLMDLAGKIVLEQRISSTGTNRVRIDHLTPGLYLLRLTDKEGRMGVKKIVVSR